MRDMHIVRFNTNPAQVVSEGRSGDGPPSDTPQAQTETLKWVWA